MQVWRRIRNIILWAILVAALIFTTIASLLYYNRTSLIEMFVAEANQYLNTPIEISSIELDILSNFPYATFKLSDVKVYESSEVMMDYLAEAERIEFSYNVLLLLFKEYEINALSIHNAKVNIGRGVDGDKNYLIFHKAKTGTSDTEISLKRLTLTNTIINFHDIDGNVKVALKTDNLTSRIKYRSDLLYIELEGLVQSDSIMVENVKYLAGEKLDLKSEFNYVISSGKIRFEETLININAHDYLLQGFVNSGVEKTLDLEITTDNNDLQSIVAILPLKFRKALSAYKSRGQIEFSGKIAGSYAGKDRPFVSFEYTGNDVDFYYPGYKNSFRKLNFTGKFNNGKDHNLTSSEFVLENFSGYVDKHVINGKLKVKDLKALNTDLSINGKVELSALLQTFPIKPLETGSGEIEFDVLLTGSLGKKKRKGAAVKASGELNLKEVHFKTIYSDLGFNNFNGVFQFNNLDLGIQSFSGKIGHSDFRLNGFFKNIIPYVVNKDRPIKIEADLNADYLDLNELFTLNFSDKEVIGKSKYSLNISPKLDIDFNCKVKNVDLKRFNAKDVTGGLFIKNSIAIIENAEMKTMGGNLNLSGSIVSKQSKLREFLVDATLDQIQIDSVFYVFNNFNQNFLQYKHLDGGINAQVNTYFVMDNDFRFLSETLTSYIEATISNGRLIEFTPVYSLSKYIKDADLSQLEFSELQNNIQVRNREVIIPDMEIISNAYHIFVSGTHDFDQSINYHFKIPLNQFRKEDRDKRFGQIEQDEEGIPNLFLKMEGHAGDFDVSLDKKAVKNKIKSDLKKEGRELKEIFKKKKEDPKQAELEEDEYIDY